MPVNGTLNILGSGARGFLQALHAEIMGAWKTFWLVKFLVARRTQALRSHDVAQSFQLGF